MSQYNKDQVAAFKVFNGLSPLKEPRAICTNFDFTGTVKSFNYDLAAGQEQDKVEFIQGLYVDNSASLDALYVQNTVTQQLLTWPAGYQGYMPVLSPNTPTFKIYTTTGAAIVPIQFLNFPVAAVMWPANTSIAAVVVTQQSGDVGTDSSANKPALLGNLLATLAVNAARKQFEVQNQSAGTIQVVMDDGVGANVSIILLAGTGVNNQGGAYSSMVEQGRVRVFATNATDQVFIRQN